MYFRAIVVAVIVQVCAGKSWKKTAIVLSARICCLNKPTRNAGGSGLLACIRPGKSCPWFSEYDSGSIERTQQTQTFHLNLHLLD